ncbi:MAG: MoxR family ATPase, partial [Lachnospiraceae bacterium]|nr:MoxR family ATPase [Lachnospiraceae bacterium]
TGVSVYNMKTGEFEYREGAIMKEIILADEINRTSPKTQSALLEAMAEGSVTVDGQSYSLPDPFMVIATQNPVEFVGTYPLPEASVDRFMMCLRIGYPGEAEEIRLARNFVEGKVASSVTPVCGREDLLSMKKQAGAVIITDPVIGYAREIADLTRKEPRFVLGASPRALLSMISAAQAKAFLSGRDFVKPDDIKAVAVNVLHHRLVLTPEARIAGEKKESILSGLLLKAKVPAE